MIDALVRPARPADVESLVAFGDAHIRDHYAPLLGPTSADAQVRTW